MDNLPIPPRCPDCNAPRRGPHIEHEPSCPFNSAVEAVTAADKRWFEDHPAADYYWRPISDAEIAEQRFTTGHAPDRDTTRVRVTKYSADVRTRETFERTAR